MLSKTVGSSFILISFAVLKIFFLTLIGAIQFSMVKIWVKEGVISCFSVNCPLPARSIRLFSFKS